MQREDGQLSSMISIYLYILVLGETTGFVRCGDGWINRDGVVLYLKRGETWTNFSEKLGNFYYIWEMKDGFKRKLWIYNTTDTYPFHVFGCYYLTEVIRWICDVCRFMCFCSDKDYLSSGSLGRRLENSNEDAWYQDFSLCINLEMKL